MSGDHATVATQGVKRKLDDVEVKLTSHVEIDEVKVAWDIENFSRAARDEIQSPVFIGGRKLNHVWKLLVNPNNDFGLGKDRYYCSVGIKLVSVQDGSEAEVRFWIRIQIVNEDNCTVVSHQMRRKMKPGDFFSFGQFIPEKQLFQSYDQEVDILRVRCQLHIEVDIRHDNCAAGSSTDVTQVIGGVSTSKLSPGDASSDVVVMACGKNFLVHRRVLEASEWFKSKLQNNGEVVKVPVGTGTPQSIEIMVKYMYTQEITLDDLETHAVELFKLARHTGLAQLKSAMEDFLVETISSDNVFELFMLEGCEGGKLKEKTYEYIQAHAEVDPGTNNGALVNYRRYVEASQLGACGDVDAPGEERRANAVEDSQSTGGCCGGTPVDGSQPGGSVDTPVEGRQPGGSGGTPVEESVQDGSGGTPVQESQPGDSDGRVTSLDERQPDICAGSDTPK